LALVAEQGLLELWVQMAVVPFLVVLHRLAVVAERVRQPMLIQVVLVVVLLTALQPVLVKVQQDKEALVVLHLAQQPQQAVVAAQELLG
jgi:hypothetical protein